MRVQGVNESAVSAKVVLGLIGTRLAQSEAPNIFEGLVEVRRKTDRRPDCRRALHAFPMSPRLLHE